MTALLALAVLVGCGSQGSDEDQIRATYRESGAAVAEGDGARFCELLTREGRRQMMERAVQLEVKGDCPQAIEEIKGLLTTKDLKYLRTSKVNSIEISGDTASVYAPATSDGATDPTQLRKVSGDWLIDADPEEQDDGAPAVTTPGK